MVRENSEMGESETILNHDGKEEPVANADSKGLERWALAKASWEALRLGTGGGSEAGASRVPKPSLCRGDDGLFNRMDRLRGLGNAVVPAQAREAFERLMGLK
jgi:hypothetical protein